MSEKYNELCDKVDKLGGYMTDPIGKCLRTISGGPPFRIDLDYKNSKTYKSFLHRVKLGSKFKFSRVEPAYLMWIEKPKTGQRCAPFPVLVDRQAEIICEVWDDGTRRFGCLEDVKRCISYHKDWKPDFR